MPSTGLFDATGITGSTMHEIFGALERGVEVVAHLGRREAIEQPVELALEAGRVLARGPARAHFRLDLGGKLVDVDVVVGQDRSPPNAGQYRPSPGPSDDLESEADAVETRSGPVQRQLQATRRLADINGCTRE